jgi:hypothetical protein
MDPATPPLTFGLLALFSVAATVVAAILLYKRPVSFIDERPLNHQGDGIAGSDKPFWTLQQFDNLNGKPWCALLQHAAAGVLRGWTGYRPELEALARILNITPRELPVTTSEEFFIRAAISALRPPVL